MQPVCVPALFLCYYIVSKTTFIYKGAPYFGGAPYLYHFNKNRSINKIKYYKIPLSKVFVRLFLKSRAPSHPPRPRARAYSAAAVLSTALERVNSMILSIIIFIFIFFLG